MHTHGGTADGCGEWGETPRVGARVRRWAVRRVLHLLRNVLGKDERGDLAALLLPWYADRVERFLGWTPHETFQGAGYSAGTWQVDERAVVDAIPRACAAFKAERLRARRAWPITDEVVDAALASDEAPEEPPATNLLRGPRPGAPSEAWHRLFRMRDRLAVRLEQRCQTCDEWFKPDARGQRRCRACRGARRKRCETCRAIFSPADGRVRSCDACRGTAARARGRPTSNGGQ